MFDEALRLSNKQTAVLRGKCQNNFGIVGFKNAIKALSVSPVRDIVSEFIITF